MTTTWTDEETMKLVEQWRGQGIQEQLEGAKRNNHVYKRLSGVLAKEGVRKSGEQCKTESKKVWQDYKKIKDKHNLTERGRATWKVYEPLNEILGKRPAVVLDTLEPTSLGAKENQERSDEDEVDEDGSSPVIIEDNNDIDMNETQESVSHSRSTTPESSTTVKAIKGRGRREK